MKKLKRRAQKYCVEGVYFTLKDLKKDFNLDCSEATIANALKQPGKVRAGRRGEGSVLLVRLPVRRPSYASSGRNRVSVEQNRVSLR